MPLIKLTSKGAEQVMSTRRYDGDAPALLGAGEFATVDLETYLAENAEALRTDKKVGVRLAPADDAARLEPFLGTLDFIEIDFPKYVDGRGFSHAQLLRRRYGYDGEICAVGQVLRDELDKMARCGFNAFDLSVETNTLVDIVLTEVSRYAHVYQPAANGAAVIFRHRLAKPSAEASIL